MDEHAPLFRQRDADVVKGELPLLGVGFRAHRGPRGVTAEFALNSKRFVVTGKTGLTLRAVGFDMAAKEGQGIKSREDDEALGMAHSRLSVALKKDNDLEGFLLRTLEFLVEMVPLEEPLDAPSGGLVLPDKAGGRKPAVLCGKIGKEAEASYTFAAARHVENVEVGNPRTGCMGRCGPGCGGAPTYRHFGKRIYTRACLALDACERRAGRGFGDCSDEFMRAADDYFQQRACISPYLHGTWTFERWSGCPEAVTGFGEMYLYGGGAGSGSFWTSDGKHGSWSRKDPRGVVFRFEEPSGLELLGMVDDLDLEITGRGQFPCWQAVHTDTAVAAVRDTSPASLVFTARDASRVSGEHPATGVVFDAIELEESGTMVFEFRVKEKGFHFRASKDPEGDEGEFWIDGEPAVKTAQDDEALMAAYLSLRANLDHSVEIELILLRFNEMLIGMVPVGMPFGRE